ncbi:MAG: YbjN domain-containing protein [Sphingomonas sp.]
MKRSLSMGAAAFCLMMLAGAGSAQAQTASASNPSSIQDAMQAAGFQAALSKGSDGDPMITSGASGSKFVVLFYGCTSNRNCTSIQFYAGFSDSKMTVGDMNEWNKSKRFGHAYIDKDGDPCIEMDLDLDSGGMSRALFQDNLSVWSDLVSRFKTKVRGG